jgi:chromosome segregation ATPase
MAKASIHFNPVKGNSEAHNLERKGINYNFPDLAHTNESWVESKIDDRLKIIQRHCKQISKRKLQKNAIPIREAVVNMNSHHSMADLKKLAEELKKGFGIECFQIHIHRDEGKSRQELNYHAHLLFDWQDKKTGKMNKKSPLELSQMQTLVAQSMGMERGELRVNSNTERLEAVEYKRHQEELRLQKIQEDLQRVEKEKKGLDATIQDTQQALLSALSEVEAKKAYIGTVETKLKQIKAIKEGLEKGSEKVMVKHWYGWMDSSKTAENVQALVMENKELQEQNQRLSKPSDLLPNLMKDNDRLQSSLNRLFQIVKDLILGKITKEEVAKDLDIKIPSPIQKTEERKRLGKGI